MSSFTMCRVSFPAASSRCAGRLPSYYLKQLAQAAVAEVPGVIEVHNRVEVVATRATSDLGWTRTGALVTVQAG